MTTKQSTSDKHNETDSPNSLGAVKASFLEARHGHSDEFVRAFHEAEYREAMRLTGDIADYFRASALTPSDVEIQKRHVTEAESKLSAIITDFKSNIEGAEREARARERGRYGGGWNHEDEEDLAELQEHIRVQRQMIDEIMEEWKRAKSVMPSQAQTSLPAASPAADPSRLQTSKKTPAGGSVAQVKLTPQTWWDASSDYIAQVMRAGQFATAKDLYRALEAKAGPDSPFEMGTGQNRGSLFVREISQTLSIKSVQNRFPELKKLAER